jgi:hypothetical protein
VRPRKHLRSRADRPALQLGPVLGLEPDVWRGRHPRERPGGSPGSRPEPESRFSPPRDLARVRRPGLRARSPFRDGAGAHRGGRLSCAPSSELLPGGAVHTRLAEWALAFEGVPRERARSALRPGWYGLGSVSSPCPCGAPERTSAVGPGGCDERPARPRKARGGGGRRRRGPPPARTRVHGGPGVAAAGLRPSLGTPSGLRFRGKGSRPRSAFSRPGAARDPRLPRAPVATVAATRHVSLGSVVAACLLPPVVGKFLPARSVVDRGRRSGARRRSSTSRTQRPARVSAPGKKRGWRCSAPVRHRAQCTSRAGLSRRGRDQRSPPDKDRRSAASLLNRASGASVR